MDQLFLPAIEANTGEKIKSNGFQKSRIQGFTGNNREFSRKNYRPQQYQGVRVSSREFSNCSREFLQALTIRPS